MKTKEQLLLIACLMVTLCETGKDAEDLIQQGCVRKNWICLSKSYWTKICIGGRVDIYTHIVYNFFGKTLGH